MTSPPHPSTLGEILDRTANIYRANFLKFLGIAAPPAAVLLGCMGAIVLLVTMSTGAQKNAAASLAMGLGVLGLVLIAVPLYLGASALSSAALSHAGSAASLDEAITIRGSYRAIWKQGWRYVGLYVLQGLAIFLGPFVVWMIAVTVLTVMATMTRQSGAAAGAAAGVMMLFLMAALGVIVIWILLMVCMAFPASVVENLGPWTALKRAAVLSKGTRWRILVLYLLGAAIGYIVSIVLILPVFFLAFIPGLNTPQKSQLLGTILVIVFYGISFAVQAVTKPIYGIAVVLFYYDQRVRKEGFDIELLMRQAGMVAEPAAAQAAPWMPAVARADETWPERGPAPAQAEAQPEPQPAGEVARETEGGTA